jgi:hypothetical protein
MTNLSFCKDNQFKGNHKKIEQLLNFQKIFE